MNAFIRNLLAGIGGVVVGSIVNMALVNVGPSVVPLPEGASVSSMEGLRESMSLFTPANFIFPFLGHALGTLVGAFAAVKLAASDHMKVALGVGVFFLIGGAMMVKMIGGPMWYNMVDLLLAYLPMGFLGGALARRKAS
ncbi:MAG: hypothetical protein P1U82_01705 [Verrucomicrobiales bacterium]|jgi:hypothetical protein|nr:hypothetical protein [Verrucomicrobiales bacterium]